MEKAGPAAFGTHGRRAGNQVRGDRSADYTYPTPYLPFGLDAASTRRS